MDKKRKTKSQLIAENEQLSLRLDEAEETLRAIRSGEVDAIVVRGAQGTRVFSLKGVESFYRTIVESINEGAATLNSKGVVLYANTRFSEMLKSPLKKILSAPFDTFVIKKDRDAYSELLGKGFKKGSRGEVSLARGGKASFQAYISLNPLLIDEKPGASVVVTDLTEVKRKEAHIRILYKRVQRELQERKELEKIKEHREFINAVLNNAGSLIVVVDRKGKIVMCNNACESLTGHKLDEVKGKPARDLFMIPEKPESFKKEMQKARPGIFPEQHESRLKARDGGYRIISWTNTAITGGRGAVRYIIATGNDITERKRLEEENRHLAHHDPLTGLPNRRLFMDVINLELAQARRNRKKLAILFLDLDRFKEINDTLGHEAGDELLKAVSERLKASIRESDTVARIGGDEFNIILADLPRTEHITSVAQKIKDSFKEPFVISGHEIRSTTSIGISVYPDDSEKIDTLFRYADIAMYHAKEMGRNIVQFYNPAINLRSIERTRMEDYLRQAVAKSELRVHYQPQVDIKTGRIICAEALVRWEHPVEGLLKPGRFIQLAEETGFITDIDEWMLRTVGEQVRSWNNAGMPSLCITVNLSSRQFQNPELTRKTADILQETGMSPDCLDIEITESMAMADIEYTASRLRELADMGVRISLDDFGTGYSPLIYLKRLPIRRLKIGRPFIQNIATDTNDQAIVAAVATLAHGMKWRVTAEGVETDEQLSSLNETQCDEAQGYLFSRPLPAEEFKELLSAGK